MYEVTIKTSDGDSFGIYLCGTTEEFKRLTVRDLAHKIIQKKAHYDPDDFIFHFKDRHLPHDDSLYEAGIENGSEIHLRISCRSGASRSDSMDRLADFDRCILL